MQTAEQPWGLLNIAPVSVRYTLCLHSRERLSHDTIHPAFRCFFVHTSRAEGTSPFICCLSASLSRQIFGLPLISGPACSHLDSTDFIVSTSAIILIRILQTPTVSRIIDITLHRLVVLFLILGIVTNLLQLKYPPSGSARI